MKNNANANQEQKVTSQEQKSTGIVRRLDELGRVVIPIEIRNQFNIAVKDPIEIFVDGNSIILKKYSKNCIFCGCKKEIVEYKDKSICKKCLSEIQNMLGEQI